MYALAKYTLLPYHYWVNVQYVYRISDIDYQDHRMLRSSRQKKVEEMNTYIETLSFALSIRTLLKGSEWVNEATVKECFSAHDKNASKERETFFRLCEMRQCHTCAANLNYKQQQQQKFLIWSECVTCSLFLHTLCACVFSFFIFFRRRGEESWWTSVKQATK